MAKFFQLSLNGKIINGIAVAEEDCMDANGNFDETIGKQFCESITKVQADLWVSEAREELPNRKGDAGINGYYLEDLDMFKISQPFPSWTFNTNTGKWDCPVTKPAGDQLNYTLNGETVQYEHIDWDEDNQRWFSKKMSEPIVKVYWDTNTSTWIEIVN